LLKLFSKKFKDKNIKSLSIWIFIQTKNYKKKIEGMKEITIYNEWESFINDDDYKEFFQTK